MITTTGALPRTSPFVMPRPRRTWVPIAAKYSGVTAFTFGLPVAGIGIESRPGRPMSYESGVLNGSVIVRPAARTPGSAATRSRRRS